MNQLMNEEQCRAFVQTERWQMFAMACSVVVVFNLVAYILSKRYTWARRIWTGRWNG